MKLWTRTKIEIPKNQLILVKYLYNLSGMRPCEVNIFLVSFIRNQAINLCSLLKVNRNKNQPPSIIIMGLSAGTGCLFAISMPNNDLSSILCPYSTICNDRRMSKVIFDVMYLIVRVDKENF